MVKRAKPQKKPKRSSFEVMTRANCLNFAIMVRYLVLEHGLGEKEMDDFIESYVAQMSEVADGRTNVTEFVRDTKTLTGIDVEQLIIDTYKQGLVYKESHR